MPAELQVMVHQVLDAGMAALELAHRRGVKMVYGTDLLGSMHRHQLLEFSIRTEVQPTIDVIRAATVNAAELFGMAGEIGVRGRGRAGRPSGGRRQTPLDDVSVLQAPDRHLTAIMKDGTFYKDELD